METNGISRDIFMDIVLEMTKAGRIAAPHKTSSIVIVRQAIDDARLIVLAGQEILKRQKKTGSNVVAVTKHIVV